MRIPSKLAALSLVAVAGCGLENMFTNLGHEEFQRPASVIRGSATWQGAAISQISVIGPDGAVIVPFQAQLIDGTYELRLNSSQYSMLRVKARTGNLELRTIVPLLAPESVVQGADLDLSNTTETLIAEARLSADLAGGALDATFSKVTPSAYVATRKLIQEAILTAGPTKDLFDIVSRLAKPVPDGLYDASSGSADPDFFAQPVLDASFTVKTSPLNSSVLANNPFDYLGTGVLQHNSAAFDAKLKAVAQLFSPTGCMDPDHIRVVFTVDFNAGDLKDGACSSLPQFKWATDKPGKKMFFVGWIHKDSDLQPNDPDPVVAASVQSFYSAMGLSSPNTIPMFDDGTNGDEKANDNIWTISFVAPRSKAGKVLRIGYKYTWGFQGGGWSGSEEWPGNSRILEVVDDNADNFVFRRDIWADEATNKDLGNLNPYGSGKITWTTDLSGCGTPESHENLYYAPDYCVSGGACDKKVPTPKGVGPIKVACTSK
jgi:hypothetical protein